MNWLGELIQKEVTQDDSVVSLGCGIMHEIWGLKCKSFLGIDIYQPYINKMANLGIPVVCADITKYKFIDKYDVVLALDILEHLEYIDAIDLLNKMKEIANKKIIVYTPSKFFNNIDKNWRGENKEIFEWMENDIHSPWAGLGFNKYQEHKCLISINILRDIGFKTSTNNIDKNIYAIWENK